MKKQWGQSQQSWQTSEKSRDESTTAQSLSFSVCVCVCVCVCVRVGLVSDVEIVARHSTSRVGDRFAPGETGSRRRPPLLRPPSAPDGRKRRVSGNLRFRRRRRRRRPDTTTTTTKKETASFAYQPRLSIPPPPYGRRLACDFLLALICMSGSSFVYRVPWHALVTGGGDTKKKQGKKNGSGWAGPVRR